MKKRHHVLLLLFLAGIINDLDRSALSVAAPLTSKDLGLGPADLGFVFSSFFVGYALFDFVGGWPRLQRPEVGAARSAASRPAGAQQVRS